MTPREEDKMEILRKIKDTSKKKELQSYKSLYFYLAI